MTIEYHAMWAGQGDAEEHGAHRALTLLPFTAADILPHSRKTLGK